MDNKEKKRPIPVELGDDMLDGVSGGIRNDPNIEWGTCPYCCGYIVFCRYGVDVPNEEIKCEGCGYMPSDPSTIPDMDALIGG